MNSKLLLIGLVVGVVLITGCTQQKLTCNKPYILVGNDCCLDENSDNICDKDKPVQTTVEATPEEAPDTTIEATTTLEEQATTTLEQQATTTVKSSAPLKWTFTAADEITAVALSDDAKYVIVGSKDRKAYMLDKSGRVRWNRSAGKEVTALEITPDGRYIGLGFESISDCGNTFYLLRYDNQILWELEKKSRYCYGQIDFISLVPTVSYLVLGANKKAIAAFNISGQEQWSRTTIYELGGISATGDLRAIVGLWSDYVHHFDNDSSLWEFQARGDINRVMSTITGSYTAIASKDGYVYLLDSEGVQLWKRKTGDKVNTVTITSDAEYIAAGSSDKNVYLFDNSGKQLFKYETLWDVLDLDISFNGEYIAVGGRDRSIYLLNNKGELIWKYETGGAITDVEITSDAKYILAGSEDNTTYFFEGPGTSEEYKPKTIKCYSSFDCGSEGEVYYCKGNEASRGLRMYTCNYPGEERSSCKKSILHLETLDTCMGSRETCVNGQRKCKSI